MIHPANKILNRRTRTTRRRWAFALSIALHAVLVALAFGVPYLMALSQPPLEFRTVTIVPLQARGVPSPEPVPEPERPAPPEPPRPTPPKEEPRQSAPSPQASQKTEPRPERTTPSVPEPKQRRGSPLGSDLASSPFGAAGVGLDNPDFTYGYYIDQLLSMIGSRWSRPRVDGRPESLLFFRIQRDGSVTDLRLVESSGIQAFDEAALSAVRQAAPLPPLPASYDRDSLGVSLVVR